MVRPIKQIITFLFISDKIIDTIILFLTVDLKELTTLTKYPILHISPN